MTGANSPKLQDFALISRIRDSETGHVVVVIGGLYTYGTEAAGEFLTDPELMRAVANQVRPERNRAKSADCAGNDGDGRNARGHPGYLQCQRNSAVSGRRTCGRIAPSLISNEINKLISEFLTVRDGICLSICPFHFNTNFTDSKFSSAGTACSAAPSVRLG